MLLPTLRESCEKGEEKGRNKTQKKEKRGREKKKKKTQHKHTSLRVKLSSGMTDIPSLPA